MRALSIPAATLLPALAILIAAPPANAQSFDCAKASTAVEMEICNDPALGALDSALGDLYAALLPALGEESQPNLRQSQRDWLAQRDTCQDAPCLSAAYVERLQALDREYDAFPGWVAAYDSWSDLTLQIEPAGTGKYAVSLDGAGANWTCSGRFEATEEGKQLAVSGTGVTIYLQQAGTGVFISDDAEMTLDELVSCGAQAPQLTGFYTRK